MLNLRNYRGWLVGWTEVGQIVDKNWTNKGLFYIGKIWLSFVSPIARPLPTCCPPMSHQWPTHGPLVAYPWPNTHPVPTSGTLMAHRPTVTCLSSTKIGHVKDINFNSPKSGSERAMGDQKLSKNFPIPKKSFMCPIFIHYLSNFCPTKRLL